VYSKRRCMQSVLFYFSGSSGFSGAAYLAESSWTQIALI